MRKIQLSISIGSYVELGTVEVSDELTRGATAESRWRLGVGLINEKPLPVERRLLLMDVEYRYHGNLLDPKCIEAWMPSEYMEWRDG